MPSGVSERQTGPGWITRDRPFRVEPSTEKGQPIFTIVSPSGDRLYSFTDVQQAEAEASVLNVARSSAGDQPNL